MDQTPYVISTWGLLFNFPLVFVLLNHQNHFGYLYYYAQIDSRGQVLNQILLWLSFSSRLWCHWKILMKLEHIQFQEVGDKNMFSPPRLLRISFRNVCGLITGWERTGWAITHFTQTHLKLEQLLHFWEYAVRNLKYPHAKYVVIYVSCNLWKGLSSRVGRPFLRCILRLEKLSVTF